jgi:hypothetical protein
MAATIKVPVSRPAGLQHRQLLALITVGVALVLAVTAALIVIRVARGLASAPAGHRTGTPVVVPHPALGPSGS